MKKICFFILCMIFCFQSFFSFAAENTSETMFTTARVNIRREPNTESEIIAVLEPSSKIVRTGQTDDGWSKVIYDGKEYYIKSDYLSLVSNKADAEVVNGQKEETTEDNSTPRLMVVGYELSGNCLSPEKSAELKITFKNYSLSKSIYNIKLSVQETSGDILTVGMPTKYVKSISAGGTYIWNVELTATNTASIGQHDLSVSAEYEDKNFNSYTASDTVRIDIKQPVKLKYSGAVLPKKVIQGDTQTVTIELMNTGKATVYNCSIDYEIEHLQSGGSVFVGNIEPAESAQGLANLRVDGDFTGEAKGKIIITYEDNYGKQYTKTIKVSTVIEKKAESLSVDNNEEKEKKNSLWWLFILIGLAMGAGAGFGIPWFINDRKQRKEDDLRL